MDADTVVQLCTEIYNGNDGVVFISNFVSDDVSSTRKMLYIDNNKNLTKDCPVLIFC